jgi:hypothetical protein
LAELRPAVDIDGTWTPPAKKLIDRVCQMSRTAFVWNLLDLKRGPPEKR